jgi:spore coat polysaccharide biosynthesis protein SpsF (cytidylyltransferase family)
MKILLGIQARSASTRFPNKHAALVGGVPILERIHNTCCSVSVFPKVNVFKALVLIPEEDEVIFKFCNERNIEVYIGSKEDLVTRYWETMEFMKYDAIVRITGDCPLIPKSIIEDVVKGLMEVDYVTNVNPRTYPDGYDCQGISYKGLEWLNESQKDNREHIFEPLDMNPNFLKRFMESGLSVRRLINPQKVILNPYHPENKLSVDVPEDLARIERMMKGKK